MQFSIRSTTHCESDGCRGDCDEKHRTGRWEWVVACACGGAVVEVLVRDENSTLERQSGVISRDLILLVSKKSLNFGGKSPNIEKGVNGSHPEYLWNWEIWESSYLLNSLPYPVGFFLVLLASPSNVACLMLYHMCISLRQHAPRYYGWQFVFVVYICISLTYGYFTI